MQKTTDQLKEQFEGFINHLKQENYNENTTSKLQQVLALSEKDGTIHDIDQIIEKYNHILPKQSLEILSKKYSKYIVETIRAERIHEKKCIAEGKVPAIVFTTLSKENNEIYNARCIGNEFFKSLVDKELVRSYQTNGRNISDISFRLILDEIYEKVNTIDMVIDRQYWVDYYDSVARYEEAGSRNPKIPLAKLLIEHKLVQGEKYKTIVERIRKEALSPQQYGDNYDIIADLILDGKIDKEYNDIYNEFLPKLLKKYGAKEKERFKGLIEKGIISEGAYSEMLTETLEIYRKKQYEKYDSEYLNIIDCIYDYGIPPKQCEEDISSCFIRITRDNAVYHTDKLCKILEFGIIDLKKYKNRIEKFFWHVFAEITTKSDYKLKEGEGGTAIVGFDRLKNLIEQLGIFELTGFSVPLEIFEGKKKMFERAKETGNIKYEEKRGINLKVEKSRKKEGSYTYYNQIERLTKMASYFDESDKEFLQDFLNKRIETTIQYKRGNSDFIKELKIILENSTFIDRDVILNGIKSLVDAFPTSRDGFQYYQNRDESKQIRQFIAWIYSVGVLVKGDNQPIETQIKGLKLEEAVTDELINRGFFEQEEIDRMKSETKAQYYEELEEVRTHSRSFNSTSTGDNRITNNNVEKHINRQWLRSFHKPEYLELIENGDDEKYGDEINSFMQFLEYGVEIAKKCVISEEIREKIGAVIEHFEQFPKKISVIKNNSLLDKDLEELYTLVSENNVIGLREYDVDHFYKSDEKIKISEFITLWGAKAVYDYLGQGEREVHDAVEQNETLIKFYKKEFGKKNRDNFITVILKEVGSSNIGHYQLNNFLRQYKTNRRNKIKKELESEKGIKNEKFNKLSEHILSLDESGELHTRRKWLYQIGDICYILSQKPALLKINTLAESNNPDDKLLYEYYSTGILSPREKDVEAMMTMYTEPEKFLGLDDTDAPSSIHRQKKPKHMVTSFPYLDMDAKDLVNSLPLGIYDNISYFKPLQMTVVIDKNNNVAYTEGLSALDEMIPSLLSSIHNKELSTLVNNYNNTDGKNKHQDVMSFNLCKNDFDSLPIHQKEWLKKQLGCQKFTAQISPKSDISNRYNGFNCDSLSLKHGKKVVMMFNPYCADFCLYKDEVSDKEDNLLATSWITLNTPTGKNITDIVKELEQGNDPRTIFEDTITQQDPEYILTLDNVEANANFAASAKVNPKKKEMLQKIYRLFFQEYIKKNKLSPNNVPINTKKINCGTTYGKIDIFDEKEENTTLPIFLNSYSDNIKENTLKVEINAGDQRAVEKKEGIYPMSIEDILKVIYLEGTIYPKGIKEHAANIQHEITASIINNQIKKRKNLSFVSYDSSGTMVGYCLAYQGTMGKKDKEPCIYIKDLAVSKKGVGNGLKLIIKLMKEIESQDIDLPIIAELREKTSYPLVMKLLPRYGYKVTKDNVSKFRNGETKHEVIIQKDS